MKQLRCMPLVLFAGLTIAGCADRPELTGSGEINLAGCEVPAGISREKAEAIACGQHVTQATADQDAPLVADRAISASDEAVIDAVIAAEGRMSGASEFRDSRQSLAGELTGSGQRGVVVLYTLEGHGGGNNYSSHIAGFLRAPEGPLRFVSSTAVSGTGDAVQDFGLDARTVTLKLLVQGPDDATCCPSVENDVAYVLHGDTWLQVQPAR